MLTLIQRGLWGEDKFVGVASVGAPLEEWMIVLAVLVFDQIVPKSQDENFDDWARVALRGFDTWLRFWGIDHAPVRILGRSVPLQIERKALRALERQACDFEWTGGEPLTSIHRQAAKLERFYLAHYELDQFAVDYRRFVKKHVAPGEALSLGDAPLWIADRLNMRHSNGELATLSVVGLLAGVSAMCRTALDHDDWPNLEADIRRLVVRTEYKATIRKAA